MSAAPSPPPPPTPSSTTPPPTSTPPGLRVAVLTMTRDEAGMLPRWLGYYGSQVGVENLFVIDDNTVDASTDDLPCAVLHMPPGPWKASWMQTRIELVNQLSRGLLSCFDVVVFTDVDEFLVPDPEHHDGLLGYLEAREADVIGALALNVLHDSTEPALDPDRPVLAQRRLVKFAPGMCKPLLKRSPAPWLQGFHGIKAPYEIDPQLMLLHLKYADADALAEVGARRQRIFLDERRGSAKSSWPLGADELRRLLGEWVADAGAEEVAEFSAASCDLSTVVHAMPGGYYRSRGPQTEAPAAHPLMRLPDRFDSIV